MKDISKSLSIIAYYLSEYDKKAVNSLGYETTTQAFKSISIAFNRDNNYLKLRRDEFDALPTSASHRKGWRNRPAASDVIKLSNELTAFTFDELTEIVKALLPQDNIPDLSSSSIPIDSSNLHEYEIESIINAIDSSATYKIQNTSSKTRIYKASIIHQLKKLYGGRCQICGCHPFESMDVDICEGHHIDYFSTSTNNDANNIIILCPNHHRLIHKLDPTFNYSKLTFEFSSNEELAVNLNFHL